MEKVRCEHCGADNANDAKYCSSCGYQLPVKNDPAPQVADAATRKRSGGKRSLSSIIIGVAMAIVGGSIGTYLVQRLRTTPIDKALMEAASEFNKNCPIVVDQLTRVDNAVALPDKTFQYNYTIDLNASEIDTNAFNSAVAPGLLNNIRTSTDMKAMRDHDVTFIYNYRDKVGKNIYKLRISPEMYK